MARVLRNRWGCVWGQQRGPDSAVVVLEVGGGGLVGIAAPAFASPQAASGMFPRLLGGRATVGAQSSRSSRPGLASSRAFRRAAGPRGGFVLVMSIGRLHVCQRLGGATIRG